MSKLLDLAWRNIWRNRRRSLITICAISFSVLIVAVTRSLQYGTYDAMESMAVRLFIGEMQIHRDGFQEEQTLNYFLLDGEIDLRALVDSSDFVTGFSRRLTGFGLVGSDSSSAGALIVGIEPEREKQVTKFSGLIREGSALHPHDDHQVLLGATLARNLRLVVGDTLVVLTQGYRNQMGADVYVLKGMVSVGTPELDRNLMVMPLHNAQELFSLDGGVTEILLSTDNFRNATKYTRTLASHLASDRYEVLSWEEMMPELKQIILVDNIGGAIYLIFLLIVVGFEIFNTTMMSIVERTREFGILQAIGMKSGQISTLIMIESTLKIVVALTAGLLISLLVVSILTHYPIPLSEEIREGYASYGFSLEDLTFSGKWQVYMEPLLAIAAIAFLATLYPLYRTSTMTPIEGLRRT